MIAALEAEDPLKIRWSKCRKAYIVLMIKLRKLDHRQACEKYQLSPEELQQWMEKYHDPE